MGSKQGWDIPTQLNRKTGKRESTNKIYVLGTVDGKFYRRSTGKEATKLNIAWIKKNYRDVLLKLIVNKKEKSKPKKQTDLPSYGMMVLEVTARDARNKDTQRDKIGKFKNHIIPYFKNYSIADIKTTDIELWQNKLLLKYSSSTVKQCRNILGLIFKKAVADDMISKNYVEYASNIKVQSKKKLPYTQDELKLLIDNSNGWFKVYLFLVFSTGLRIGEAIGLQWDDIDLHNGYIHLKRSISKGRISDEYDISNKTKNHFRSIPIDDELKKQLMHYYEIRPSDKWLFINKYGNHFGDSKTLNVYYWKPLIQKVGIEDKTLYATRHTYISIMKNNGADTAWLKSVIGHKQSSTVMEDAYFTHKSSAKDIKLANSFFSLLDDKKPEAVC